jgi:hypothetical protein
LTEGETAAAVTERVDDADHLVTGHHQRTPRAKVALGQVQVRATDTAGRDSDANLLRGGLGQGPLHARERVVIDGPRLAYGPRLHHLVH